MEEFEEEFKTDKEEILKKLSEALDSLISTEYFLQKEDSPPDIEDVFRAHQLQARQIIPFECLGFLILNENGLDFDLQYSWPASSRNLLQDLVNRHLDQGTFSLALNQNRPIISNSDDTSTYMDILHVLATRKDIIGMFIGLVSKASYKINSVSLKLLSAGFHTCSYVIETTKLYQQIEAYNRQLESKISSRTIQLEKSKIAAERANLAKSEFLSNMSHELRTPLTSIMGYSENMEEELRYDPLFSGEASKYIKQVSVINKNAKHLLELINNILDLSKIESGHFEIVKKDFYLQQIISDLENIFKVAAQKKGIEFKIEYLFPLPIKISSDPLRINQILTNLLSNAIKFTHKGHISLSILMNTINNMLYFTVADTGIGIDRSNIERVFKPFHQADTSTSREYGGTGLGLTICQSLARALDGVINVESEVGQGSQFFFFIPLGDMGDMELARNLDEMQTEQVSDLPLEIEQLQGNVLVADDAADNRELVKLLLSKAGLEVSLAVDGEDAVEKALDEYPDLILMDIQMPKLSGVEATKLLRKSGFSNPIIALTANVMQIEVQKYMQQGMNGFIAKPIDRQMLYSTLSKYLLKSTAPKEAQDKFTSSQDFKELTRNFIERLSTRKTLVNDAYAKKDIDSLITETHILKGLGGTFGFDSITKEAKSIETHLRQGNFDEGLALIPDFIHTLEKVIRENL